MYRLSMWICLLFFTIDTSNHANSQSSLHHSQRILRFFLEECVELSSKFIPSCQQNPSRYEKGMHIILNENYIHVAQNITSSTCTFSIINNACLNGKTLLEHDTKTLLNKSEYCHQQCKIISLCQSRHSLYPT
jgi:hypothetical protein